LELFKAGDWFAQNVAVPSQREWEQQQTIQSN